MNWEAIGAIGEILGAATVLVTLLYLAIQIRQTNDISRFSTLKDLMNSFDNLNKMVTSDPSLREVLHKTTDLSPDEHEQLYTFTNMFCNTWAMCQTAYNNGLVDEGTFNTAKKDVLFELERWPNFKSCAVLWLGRYPEWAEFEIFAPLADQVRGGES